MQKQGYGQEPKSFFVVFEAVKKFFLPIWSDRAYFRVTRGIFSIWALYSVLSVVRVKRITQSLEQSDYDRFVRFVGGFVGLVIVYQLLNLIVLKRWQVNIRILHQMNHLYLKKFFVMDHLVCESLWIGRLLHIVQAGFGERAELIVQMMMTIPRAVLWFITSARLIYEISWWYLLASLLAMTLVQIVVLWLQRFSLAIRKERVQASSEYTRQFVKMMSQKFEVLLNGKVDHEISQLDQRLDRIKYFAQKRHIYEHLAFNIPEVMITAIKIVFFFLIGLGIFHHTYQMADLFVIITVIGYFDSCIRELSNLTKQFIKKQPQLLELRDFFEQTPVITHISSWNQFIFDQGQITIQGLEYGYQWGLLFNQFSCTLKAGKVTALVGSSGAGKSTLVKLISGYIEPQEGTIYVDGQNLKNLKLESYYPYVGYLTQEPSVFDGTIRENLLYGAAVEDKNVSDERLREALEKAQADEFIRNMPKALDTQIGERGVKLSGWQRQRLAIAKIFLKDPRIVILDEPTSALDSVSEHLVSKALHQLFVGRTVIVIAHRLQTVKEADEIIVLGKNNSSSTQILERGTHEQLVKLGWQYAQLVDLQSGVVRDF